jgi:hypothetical protein
VKKTLISIGSFFTLTLPMFVLAQNNGVGYAPGPYNPGQAPFVGTANSVGTFGKVNNMIVGATGLLRSALILLISLAVVWFIYNVIKYSMSSEEDGKEKAKSQMAWGVVAIAVIVSVWGLVALLQITFGVEGQNSASSINSDFKNMIPGGN